MTTIFMRTITDATSITIVINLSLNILQAIELSTSYIQEIIDIKGWITHTIYDGSTKRNATMNNGLIVGNTTIYKV